MTTPAPPAGGGKKIMGMKPLTFYLAMGGAVVAGIAFYIYKRNQASSSSSPAATAGAPCTDASGNSGTYDSSGNCIATENTTSGDNAGELSVLQAELESLLAQQGTSSGNVTVPDVTGQTAGEAHNVLTAAGLKPVADPAQKPADKVTSTTPKAGTSVASGSSVLITASSASGTTVKVPNVNGKSAGEAHDILVSAGLVPTAPRSQRANMKVSRTAPAAGASVARGSKVTIYTSGYVTPYKGAGH